MTTASTSRARRLARAILLAVGAFLGFSLTFPWLYAALVPVRRAEIAPLPEPAPGEYRVYVADWGYHTSILIQQPAGWALGPTGEERAPFVEYAWGDRGFYMESDFRPQALFAALVLPTESVAYLDGYADPPSFRGARVAMVRTVDAATLRALATELERSVRRGADGGRAAPFPPVSGYTGRFYPAHGRYLWARDCNWWTVARLHAVGLAKRPGGVVFARQVPGRLRGFTTHVRAGARAR
ncbi:MAG TPA: DUF2459 domain-containing protein [Longimicrobium sp.]|nr:DUF2459 domain-containing protein [Longimicrobium sp.]